MSKSSPITRREFLRNAELGAAGVATMAVLAACSNGPAPATPEAAVTEENSTCAESKERYLPGTYTSTQSTGFATVVLSCDFTSNDLTGVRYEVTETSESDMFPQVADAAKEYEDRIVAAGSTINVDGISGATLCTTAIKDGVNNCFVQAMGIPAAAPVAAAASELNPQDETYDTATTDFAALFSPIQVGHMALRNRIVKSAAGSDTQGRTDTEVSQNAMDYYGRFADGGAALILQESGTLGSIGFSLGGDPAVYEAGKASVQKMADRVHQAGAYIGYQVGVGSPIEPVKVNEYTVEDIQTMVKQIGEIALRLKECGYDCIEVKGATTDGLNAFFTRRQNQREDDYGPQSFENRSRFFVEILNEIRANCGDDFSILTLINGVEENDTLLGQNDQYLTIEEAQEFAKILETAGADLVQIRMGTPGQEITCWAPDSSHVGKKMDGATGSGTLYDFSYNFGGMLDGSHSGAGAFIPAVKAIKSVVSIPVGCAGYMDPRTAPDLINNAIQNGDIDLVFMNRPLTVDPQLPNKLQAGKRDEIAPCTRCLHCHGKPYGEAETCRVNATTQFAYTEEMPEGFELIPAETVKNVMVIGGGPAGMEAARIAAERGHTVTLYDENPALGGMLTFAAAVKGPHERIEDLLAYLVHQQELKGVTVVTGQKVDIDFVKAQNPDAVVVAVGGLRDSKLTGDNIVPMNDVLGGEIGEKVIILGAGLQATDLAIHLLTLGKKIQMVHGGTEAEIAKEQSFWVRKFIRPHLFAHGVKVWNGAAVKGITDGGLAITMDNGLEKTLEYDTIIECYDMLPNTTLTDAIASAGYEVYSAGDCAEGFNIQRAIHAGNISARKI
ncbi:MAG TPA: FAD-dependent oxidoreductase [Bellilinea sp.]|nr:FAD-dependent oxidoreductase [Bellilinea sp.]